MRNGYREKSIACAILHHLESYLFLWERKRRNPLILMLYASVKVIVLVWKIMENTGSSWIYYQHWQEHQNSCCEVGRDTEKGHCSLRWLQKVQQTGFHSKETKINIFLLWDTTDKEGEATSWPNEKHVFFWWNVKDMRQRCHSKLTEHVAFLASRYDFFLGIGHIRFVHPHEIIEWVIGSQGCFITKFRNQFDSEVPVDST
jgi:hypothetical protein